MQPPFREPLGLVLSGGGAHGAWQAGCVRALVEEQGLRFHRVLGFSAGALTGAAYALDRLDQLLNRYREAAGARILRPRPRLRPLSLFSGFPIWRAVRYTMNEGRARERLRCRFTVACVDAETRRRVYARYEPGGRWDAPLSAHLVASCSIPRIFPPVEIARPEGRRVLVDGGARAAEPLDLSEFSDCRDVLVVGMTRPEEAALRSPLLGALGRRGEACVHRTITEGLELLARDPHAPRIFRFHPSRRLRFSPLGYLERFLAPALAQGAADAALLAADPAAFRYGPPRDAGPDAPTLPAAA